MVTFRGGNSAFADSKKNYSHDAGGCYRIILMRHLGYEARPIIDTEIFRQSATFALGHANEEVMEKMLKIPLEKEKSICKIYNNKHQFEGHIDLYNPAVNEIYELKSISSINTYVDVFDNNKFKPNNLAQCCAYMQAMNSFRGYLIYTNFIYSPAATTTELKESKSWGRIQPCYKKFTVDISDNSTILVDGVDFKYGLQHIIHHQEEALNCMETETVSKIKPMSTACGFCTLRDLCSGFDKGDIKNKDWIDISKSILAKKV